MNYEFNVNIIIKAEVQNAGDLMTYYLTSIINNGGLSIQQLLEYAKLHANALNPWGERWQELLDNSDLFLLRHKQIHNWMVGYVIEKEGDL
jgi:hypothetical protein